MSEADTSRSQSAGPEGGGSMKMREMPVGDTGAGPYAVAVGSDDAVWITLVHAGQIARLKPGSDPALYQLEPANCRPSQLIAGPDDAVWFTRSGDDRIGRITADAPDSSFAIDPGSAPFGITVGADDGIWFTAMGTDRVGRITPGGEVRWLDLPTEGAMASMIVAGPDGQLWITLHQANAVAQVNIDHAQATIHPLPTPKAGPVGIAATADAVWFVEILAGQIGRIDPLGNLREFPLPDRDARPHAIAADPAGGCWFTEWGANRVGHISEAGDFQHLTLPPDSEPHGLTIGPDRALWVALENRGVARIGTDQPSR